MDTHSNLITKILHLNESIWSNSLTQGKIDLWLSNFQLDEERRIKQTNSILFLLSQFMYFGESEMREMLKSLFRDKIQYKIIQGIRDEHSVSDVQSISPLLIDEIRQTRFLGVGNPSESGSHLLYYFRQVNGLDKALFINGHEIHQQPVGIRRFIFIDDLCASGSQGENYSKSIVKEILVKYPEADVAYYPIFALNSGLDLLRQNTSFTCIEAVFELDESFKCFNKSSRYFTNNSTEIDRNDLFDLIKKHSFEKKLGKEDERYSDADCLGYKDSQLLLGFAHNIPNNTLPIIWSENEGWNPIFKRYIKKWGLI